MANVIKIKKGLDINLKGKASDVLLNGGKSESYAIVPDYYNGILPKVVAKVGEKVKAGSVLMIDKNRPEIKFVSPVSGEGFGKSVLLGAVSRSCYSGKCGVYRLYGELQIHPFGL